MKKVLRIMLLLCVLIFPSCANDDDTIPQEGVIETASEDNEDEDCKANDPTCVG